MSAMTTFSNLQFYWSRAQDPQMLQTPLETHSDERCDIASIAMAFHRRRQPALTFVYCEYLSGQKDTASRQGQRNSRVICRTTLFDILLSLYFLRKPIILELFVPGPG